MGVIFMALEELLAAEFAKITNDNEKTSEGSTVYGTITKTEDKYYVILDGSDGVLTPISGSTFNYAEGDRVSCTIKNHSLTVMGNVTQPGLTKADDIEDGTIEPVKLVDGSLKVGVNVEMGSDVVLSWENLPSDVASGDDIDNVASSIPSDTYITEISKDAIKTAKISCNQLEGGNLGDSTYKMSFDSSGFSVNSGEQAGGSILISGQTTYLNGYRELDLSASIKLLLDCADVEASYGITAQKVYVESPGAVSEERSILRWYDTNGQICTTSSSRSLKEDIENVKDVSLDPNKLYDLPVRQFNYKPGTLMEGEKYTLQIGFIAEEVDEIYPSACCYDRDGNPSDWGDRHLIPPMLKLIQDQKKKIDELEERLSKLEAIVTVQNGD